jgi:hypothetical protein
VFVCLFVVLMLSLGLLRVLGFVHVQSTATSDTPRPFWSLMLKVNQAEEKLCFLLSAIFALVT